MDAFLGSPFGQMSPPDPPAPAAPRHASRPPQASATESWSAQQSSLALRFYRLGLPGVAELVLSATKLDTTALTRDATMLEAAGGTTTGGNVTPGVNVVVGREVHGSVGSSGSVGGGGGGGGGVSTPPETPSVAIP